MQTEGKGSFFSVVSFVVRNLLIKERIKEKEGKNV